MTATSRETLDRLEREAGTRISEASARAGSAVSDMAGRTAEATARAGSAVSDMADTRPKHRAGGLSRFGHGRTDGGGQPAAGDAATTASDLGRRAGSQFSDLFERHPLVLGGLGLAIGAAIAYSFRPTATEARMLGETSNRFKRRARAMAEEQFERARTVAERAYAAASDEAREQGISAEGGREAATELGRKARAVADRAQEAAREKWETPRLRSDAAGGRKPTPKEVLLRQSGGRRPAERQPSAGRDRVTCRLWRQ